MAVTVRSCAAFECPQKNNKEKALIAFKKAYGSLAKIVDMTEKKEYCMDNAAMVAIAGYYLSQKKKVKIDNYKKIKADTNWELE